MSDFGHFLFFLYFLTLHEDSCDKSLIDSVAGYRIYQGKNV
jgi:hypothetical protein